MSSEGGYQSFADRQPDRRPVLTAPPTPPPLIKRFEPVQQCPRLVDTGAVPL
jgi:hypothetical protein